MSLSKDKSNIDCSSKSDEISPARNKSILIQFMFQYNTPTTNNIQCKFQQAYLSTCVPANLLRLCVYSVGALLPLPVITNNPGNLEHLQDIVAYLSKKHSDRHSNVWSFFFLCFNIL